MDDKYYEQISLDLYGPWTIESFTKMLKDQEQAAKNRILADQPKLHKDNKYSFSRVSIDYEYGYKQDRQMYMTVYRTESLYEKRRREEELKQYEERQKKIKEASKKRADARKKKKEELQKLREELENNEDYIRYKTLEEKLKKQKLI